MDNLKLRDISDAPWKLHDGGISVVDNEGKLVASCGFLPGKTVFESRTNALVISMVPDLIGTLQELVNIVEAKNNGDHSGAISVEYAISLLEKIGAYDSDYA